MGPSQGQNFGPILGAKMALLKLLWTARSAVPGVAIYTWVCDNIANCKAVNSIKTGTNSGCVFEAKVAEFEARLVGMIQAPTRKFTLSAGFFFWTCFSVVKYLCFLWWSVPKIWLSWKTSCSSFLGPPYSRPKNYKISTWNDVFRTEFTPAKFCFSRLYEGFELNTEWYELQLHKSYLFI
jgi:hypothetical protein